MDPSEIAREASLEAAVLPVLEGLHKMSDEIMKNRKVSDEKVAEVQKASDRKFEDLEAKTNKSFEDVVARIGRLKDFSATLGNSMLRIGPGDDTLKEVIPKAFKERAGMFEAYSRSLPKGSAMSDTTVAMAIAAWIRHATHLMLPRHFSSDIQEDSRAKAAIYAALQEKHYGADYEAITKAAYAEGAAGTGGNLVPTIVEADIVRQIKDSSKLFAMGRQFQMSTNVHQVPSENTAVTVGWAAEAGTLTGGEGTFAQKTLTAKKVYSRATMSVEMVEDSSPGLLQYLLEVFSEKIGGELDKQLVLGDGSSPAITGIDGTSGITVISTSATAAGRNLTWQLLVNTYVGNGEGVAIENGYWIMSPKGYAVVFGLTDTTGQPVIKFADTATAPAGTLLGRPIILSARFGGTPSGVTATLDDTTNANTKIIYGVPTSLLCGTRMGLRWDVTDQVNWGTFSVDARLVGRFAMIVGVPTDFSRLSKVNT